jgi:hypothetical protein
MTSGTLAGNGGDPITFEELRREYGPPHGTYPTDEELHARLEAFGRAVHGLPSEVQRAHARGWWVDYLRDTDLALGSDAWRLVDVAIRAGRDGVGAAAGPPVAPVRLDAFLAEATDDAAADWILPGLFARDAVVGVAGKPKAGKTTWLTHAAVAIAEGLPFLGMATHPCGVLWLNLETSRKLARWKLRKVAGAAGSEAFHIVTGTRADCTLPVLEGWIRALGIGLVIVDSLTKWWAVEEENSGTQTTAALDVAVQLARRTGAGIVLIHHTRKNRDPGGSVMDMFRGSGAIGAALDVGIVLSKMAAGADPTLRTLECESRYDETPAKLCIRLGQYTYERVEGAFLQERERAAVAAALTPAPRTVEELVDAISDGLSESTVRRRLGELVEQGKAERGEKRGRALTWCLPASEPAAGEAA